MSFTAPKSFPKRTYGEQLVARLLDKLPSDEYYAVAEPNLIDRDGQGWKPDFVIVSAHHGVIILEIKDWRRIEDINRETVVIKKSNDTLETLPNPVHQAQNYAYILADLFQKREELMVRHNNVKNWLFLGSTRLRCRTLRTRLFARLKARVSGNITLHSEKMT